MQEQAIDTSVGMVERSADGIIHIRFRSDKQITASGLAEVLEVRKALAQGTPAGVMAHVPINAAFDLSILNVDHYEGKDAGAFTCALAIITQDKFHLHLVGFYTACFKTSFPIRAFGRSEEAHKWLVMKASKVAAH